MKMNQVNIAFILLVMTLTFIKYRHHQSQPPSMMTSFIISKLTQKKDKNYI